MVYIYIYKLIEIMIIYQFDEAFHIDNNSRITSNDTEIKG